MMLKVAVLGQTPLVAKSIARVVGSGGGVATAANSVDELQAAIREGTDLACFALEHLEQLAPTLKECPKTRPLIWSGSRDNSHVPAIQTLQQIPRANHVFGLRYPDAPPRAWELVAVIRRFGEGKPPPMDGFLDWGGGRFVRSPASDKERDVVVSEVERFVTSLASPKQGSAMAEVAHELLMNAMYDAPVDPKGRPLFAHDRTASISLSPQQRPHFLCGCDGSRVVISVVDPFGGLRREHVFGGLARALSSGTMDRSGGGAGLGLTVVYKATTLLFFDVVPRTRTQATAILELDVPQRELRTMPRSVHFFVKEP